MNCKDERRWSIHVKQLGQDQKEINPRLMGENQEISIVENIVPIYIKPDDGYDLLRNKPWTVRSYYHIKWFTLLKHMGLNFDSRCFIPCLLFLNLCAYYKVSF